MSARCEVCGKPLKARKAICENCVPEEILLEEIDAHSVMGVLLEKVEQRS